MHNKKSPVISATSLCLFLKGDTTMVKGKAALIFICLLFAAKMLSAQNIGIGTAAPEASALLDITAANKGILVPRLTAAQMNAVTAPAAGLLVYNTDSSAFAYRNTTAWVYLKGKVSGAADWSTNGNGGTNTQRDFIGTTDDKDVVFKRNGRRAGLLAVANTSWGDYALYQLTAGESNAAFGDNALFANLTGNGNTATGAQALFQNGSGNYNAAIGAQSLQNNVSGNQNFAAGYAALFENVSGNNNAAIGDLAMEENLTGNSNTAIGSSALYSNKNISNLVAVGDSALYNNGTGATLATEAVHNTAVGSKALNSNTTGYDNTSLGYQALRNNSTGHNNVAAGMAALTASTTGSFNSAYGDRSLSLNSSGEKNSAVGAGALRFNSTGTNNSAFGFSSLLTNNAGSGNAAFGVSSLQSNTTGFSNTGIGIAALNKNSKGSNLVAVGDSALFNNGADANSPQQSASNTAVGSKALYSNTTGSFNTASGYNALLSNTTGNANIAIGMAALATNSEGSNNITIGANAGYNSRGSGNIFLGNEAGSNETGSDKLYISNTAGGPGETLIYGEFDKKTLRINGRLGIGVPLNEGPEKLVVSGAVRVWNDTANGNASFYAASGAGNDEAVFVIKSDGKTFSFNGTGGSVSSDERLKQDIVPLEGSLQKLLQLNGYSYRFKTKASDTQKEIGVLAQEVKKVLPEAVYTNDNGMYAVSYNALVPLLINGVKEQQKTIQAQEERMTMQDERIIRLEALVKTLIEKK